MKIIVALMLCLLIAPALSAQSTSPTLSAVESRGQLICGIDEDVFGFGFLNPNTGDIAGIQVEFCRAIAAALLGESAAVDLRLHTLDDTLPAALTAGEIDLLFSHNFNYALPALSMPELRLGEAVIFYDGTSVMTRRSTEIVDWPSIDGATVCVVSGSPTVLDLTTEVKRQSVDIDLLELESIEAMAAAFFDGRCAAQVLDRSLLKIIRSSSSTPEDFVIWEQPFTVWPVSPIYRAGDLQWTRVVDSILWGLIQAEALDVSSQNINEYVRVQGEDTDAYVERVGPAIASLLDLSVNEDNPLGVSSDFMVSAIRQVGNYGEIYDRHLGPNSTLPIDRGLNDLWFQGGLLTSPRWQ